MTLRRTAGARCAGAALALALVLPTPAAAEPGGGSAASLTGRLLVASPDMKDPRFSRAVIYVVRHDATGAVGLVVNKPFKDVPIALLLARLGLPHEGVGGTMRMQYGGPVEPGRLFVLHTEDFRGEGTQAIAGGIAMTTTPGILRAIGTGSGPRRSLLILSYSGWAPGQLEREMRTGAWIAVPADAALVFDDDPGSKWERAIGRRVTEL
jgi:putative transcriptional regulator